MKKSELLKLFLSISLVFLFAFSSVAICMKFDQKTKISYTEDDISASSKENTESQADDVIDLELTAYLQKNVYHLSVTEMFYRNCVSKIYLSPSRIYDSPPPES